MDTNLSELSDACECSHLKVACGSVDETSLFSGAIWDAGAGPSHLVTIAGQSASTSAISWLNDPDYTVHLLDLPTEILEKIFLFTNYEQIGKVRRVCSRFNAIGSALLNSAFQRLQATMLQRFQQIKSKMPRRESARRNHPFARECDIVETVHMRLTLLQMSFGKHIERKHCCFFAGEILDEVYRIFRHIKSTPNLGRAYKVTDELFDLTTMAMEYFKEYIEPELPEITYFAADFIDSSGIKSCTWKNTTPSGSPSNSASPGPIEESPEIPPTSVLINKKIKRLRQGMKKNNGQVIILKRELKSNKSQLADQQKQLIEYGTRLEDNDKKFEEYSRKFSSLLQELNKCKTELQYWRSKSPANQPSCPNCNAAIFVIDGDCDGPIEDARIDIDQAQDKGLLLDAEYGEASKEVPRLLAGPSSKPSSILDKYEFVPIAIKPPSEPEVLPSHSSYNQRSCKSEIDDRQDEDEVPKAIVDPNPLRPLNKLTQLKRKVSSFNDHSHEDDESGSSNSSKGSSSKEASELSEPTTKRSKMTKAFKFPSFK